MKDVFEDLPASTDSSVRNLWKSKPNFDFEKYVDQGKIKKPFSDGHSVHLVMNLAWEGGSYSGMANSTGVPHGLGQLVKCGSIYEGEFTNGEKTGFSRLISDQ